MLTEKQQNTHSHCQNIYSYRDEEILYLKHPDDKILYSLYNKLGAAYIVLTIHVHLFSLV
jgi:hypothetical protein